MIFEKIKNISLFCHIPPYITGFEIPRPAKAAVAAAAIALAPIAAAPVPAAADINSPQGAIDVAAMLPGSYGFLDKVNPPKPFVEPAHIMAVTAALEVASAVPGSTGPLAANLIARAEPAPAPSPAALTNPEGDIPAAADDAELPEPAAAAVPESGEKPEPALVAVPENNEEPKPAVAAVHESNEEPKPAVAALPDGGEEQEPDIMLASAPAEDGGDALDAAQFGEDDTDDEDGSPEPTSIAELLELMRQATEANAMLERAARNKPLQPAHALASVPGLGSVMDIAVRTPKGSEPEQAPVASARPKQAAPKFTPSGSPRALMKKRGFLWPVDGLIYSAFEATRSRGRTHGAIDIRAPKGTPVAAAADGVVSVVADGGRNFRGYGKIVIIDHGEGIHTVYAHLDSYAVKMGQPVKAGQIIASVGRTGTASNYLLHHEVRVDGKKVDPLTCMEERPGVVKMVNYHSGGSGGGSKKKKK